MSDDPMTLIDRLRNPAWEQTSHSDRLYSERTIADMREAASQLEADGKRLDQIRDIIVAVDSRCMAADGPVTPTLGEITQEELSCIFALACRQPQDWKPE